MGLWGRRPDRPPPQDTRERRRVALTAERDTLTRVEAALREALSQTGDAGLARAVYIVASQLNSSPE
jgi:hypothetical protein